MVIMMMMMMMMMMIFAYDDDVSHALSLAKWHINMWTVKFTGSNVKSRVRRGNNADPGGV